MGPKKVLIVDDDEDIRQILRLVFEHDGFDVVAEAEDGLAAIPLALKHRPDFIVLDHAMPKLDGPRCAEVLRGMAPDARIVAFSAYLEDKPHWADAFLNKDRVTEIAPLVRSLMPLAVR